MPITSVVTISDPVAIADVSSPRRQRFVWFIARGAMMILICGFLVCFVIRQYASYRQWGDINLTFGVWSAGADDAAHGTLYRPLVSDLGYGGTRYAPLRTVFQAAILKTGLLGLVPSAMVISIVFSLLMLVGCYVLMRRLDLPRGLSAMMTCVALGATCTRVGVFDGMSDAQAVAFTLWGLIAITYAAENKRTSWIPLAAACFALAMASKLTSLFGVSAAIIWLTTKKQFRAAVLLGVIFALFVLALAFLFQWLSQGRMLSVLAACATGGGSSSELTSAPTIFSGELYRFDPDAGRFWILALMAIFVSRQAKSLPGLLLLVTTPGTIAIFGSPGTDLNHFVDMQIASILCIAVCLQGAKSGRVIVAGMVILLTIAAAFSSLKEVGRINQQARKDHVAAVLAMVQNDGSGPLLSDDPLLPLLAGERPYLSDCFMFRVITARDPAIGGQLWRDLAERKFRAVILSPVGGPTELQHPGSFGEEAISHVMDGYKLVKQEGRFLIFLRRDSK
jgi:hypothetical protein